MYFMKRQSDTVAQLDKDVTRLQAISVDEDRVRSVVHEQIKPLREDNLELKASIKANAVQAQQIHDILTEIKIDLARRGHWGN